jgi:hemerythrin-like metal-binding protein
MVTWSEALRTGVAEIDEQHQLLFRRAAVVREAVLAGQGTAEVQATIDFLLDYASVHFQTEAGYMAAAAYPDEQAHLDEHVKLTRTLLRAAEAYQEEGATPKLAEELVGFFERWLASHIHEHDRRLAGFLVKATTPGVD